MAVRRVKGHDDNERANMQTVRDDTWDFSTATWPPPDLGHGEVTAWAYEDATGLVPSKGEHDGRQKKTNLSRFLGACKICAHR